MKYIVCMIMLLLAGCSATPCGPCADVAAVEFSANALDVPDGKLIILTFRNTSDLPMLLAQDVAAAVQFEKKSGPSLVASLPVAALEPPVPLLTAAVIIPPTPGKPEYFVDNQLYRIDLVLVPSADVEHYRKDYPGGYFQVAAYGMIICGPGLKDYRSFHFERSIPLN